MAKTVSCRDVGMDCDFVAKGETDEDILQQCAEHARKDHNMIEIPPEGCGDGQEFTFRARALMCSTRRARASIPNAGKT